MKTMPKASPQNGKDAFVVSRSQPGHKDDALACQTRKQCCSSGAHTRLGRRNRSETPRSAQYFNHAL